MGELDHVPRPARVLIYRIWLTMMLTALGAAIGIGLFRS